MRIGTVAQHSNIGRTSPESIIDNIVPGRLNDFPIWGWWDFTDPTAVGGGDPSFALTNITEALQKCDGKGPYDVSLSTDGLAKGPTWYPKGGLGQHNHAYAWTHEKAVDYMQFTNPADLRLRNFTIIMVLDKIDDVPSQPQYFFKINSTGQSIALYTAKASNDLVFKASPNVSRTWTNFWNTTSRGGNNRDFNWIAIVGETSGEVSLYSRGRRTPPNVSEAVLTDTVIAPGATSGLFGSDFSTLLTEEALSPSGKMYEFLIYEQALTEKEMFSFDRYIKDKYNHQYGRLNGYT